MDLVSNDATLWVGISFILFVLLVQDSNFNFQKYNLRISTLKKKQMRQRLKIEAENCLMNIKKKKKKTQYIEELKKQKRNQGY